MGLGERVDEGWTEGVPELGVGFSRVEKEALHVHDDDEALFDCVRGVEGGGVVGETLVLRSAMDVRWKRNDCG